ncbi:MAG TPA: CARDB domain-containing protein [Candidatus Saccharimonadales bacterium]|nr:CARDB domain-containing protein [Candidatus Saccharimonadales bacterium]
MREIFYWIIFVVVIVAAALYLRYYYAPGINVGLGFAPGTNTTAYVYQKVTLPVEVVNNGSSIIGFEVGVLINGNLTGVYNVSLEGGKETLIQLSHTFSSPGVYNFTVVGDPAKLYNLEDRNKAVGSVVVNVLNPETPAPATLLEPGATALYSSNMSALGYAVSSFININYSVGQLGISDIGPVNAFFYPLLTFTSSYLANISYAGADYANGKEVSVWMSGYVNPSIISVSAQGLNLTFTNNTLGSENVTMVQLSGNTTLCGWYASGWIKTLAYEGNTTCLVALRMGGLGTGYNDSLRPLVPRPNDSVEIANFSYYTPRWERSGRLSLIGGTSFSYTVLWRNFTQNTVCYGIVNYVNGTSYCSVYLPQQNGEFGNLSLIKTTAYVGEDNATIFSLVNSSRIFDQVDENIGVIKAFNLSGAGLNFTSGIVNSCSFPGGFSCGNVSYGNGMLSLKVGDLLNSSATLNSVSCFWNGLGPATPINATLQDNETVGVTATCYNNDTVISGVALNLNLHLLLNYTVGNATREMVGGAFIV